MPDVKTKECKHGVLSYFAEDEFVGRSLDAYGEYSEEEVIAMQKTLRPGDVVIEVGANIGALTIPMAKMVGPTGRVYAIEPHPVNCALLRQNVEQNHLKNVNVTECAVSDHSHDAVFPQFTELGHCNYGRVELGKGTLTVKCLALDDDWSIERVNLLKIDAEGHERQIIAGAKQLIEKHRPIIYIENDRPEHAQALVGDLIDMEYRLYWHRPVLWNPKNHDGNKQNVFGGIISINMVCVPEESGIEVKNLDEVADLRVGAAMYDREIKRYNKLITKNPDDLEARLLMAHYHNLMQRCDEADALLMENLRRDPDHTASKAVRGLLALQRGDWASGWPAYELRYKQKTTEQFGNRPHKGKRWNGQSTHDPLLIWCEQGFGDSIMFARFWDDVKRRAPYAFLEVQPQLYELFETSGIAQDRLYRLGRTMPDYKHHCSLPSLPFVLGLVTDDELRADPYMKADQKMVDSWRWRQTPRIGFCWKGSPRSERPYTRDLDPDLFMPITSRHGNFLSLSQEGQFESFADTAAAIAALNLVITVDTSIAHLAGALGIETWLLLSFDPDWRWGLTGDTTIWYDSMRIFRQPAFMDWQSVVDQVGQALDQRLLAAAE